MFKERLNAAGFEFHLEPYWGPFDSFEAAQFCDVPMTEFWMGLPFWSKKPSRGGTSWDGVEKKCFDLVREYAKKGLRVGKSSQRTRYFEIASGGGDGVMASCRRAGDATPCQDLHPLLWRDSKDSSGLPE